MRQTEPLVVVLPGVQESRIGEDRLKHTIDAHLKQRGWESLYFQHVLDEAHGNEIPYYGKFAALIHRQLPGIPTLDAVDAANKTQACDPCKVLKPEERCDACKAAAIPHWHPHQLRHTHATEVRRRFGLEAAQAALGHSKADVTQLYAERDLALAAKVAAELG